MHSGPKGRKSVVSNDYSLCRLLLVSTLLCCIVCANSDQQTVMISSPSRSLPPSPPRGQEDSVSVLQKIHAGIYMVNLPRSVWAREDGGGWVMVSTDILLLRFRAPEG